MVMEKIEIRSNTPFGVLTPKGVRHMPYAPIGEKVLNN